MNWQQWSKMPCGWQTDARVHRRIRKTPIGAAIAALKLYIAFCIKANYNSKDGMEPGCVKLSLARLGRLVGLSKPMVISGLKALEDWDLAQRLQQRPAIYQLLDYVSCPNWAKLPTAHLYGGRQGIGLLTRMNNRGRRRLLALQMYLYLAAIIDGRTRTARVSYDRICELLGAGRNDVSAAISILCEDELISCRLADATDRKNPRRQSNEYWLRGTTPLREPDSKNSRDR
jgi:hypothetical protein